MWGLGCLIWEVFNGPLPKQLSLKSLENVSKVFYEILGIKNNLCSNTCLFPSGHNKV